MTTCVATMCSDRKGLILVADKMVGNTAPASEPDICKVLWLHHRWKVMLAGNDVEEAFPIIDAAMQEMKQKKGKPVLFDAMRAMRRSYREHREDVAVGKYLVPAGYGTFKEFFVGRSKAVIPHGVRGAP